MAYPNTSTWRTATPNDAWYVRRTAGGTTLCQTDGWDLLYGLASEAVHALQIAGRAVASFDGTLVDASAIPNVDLVALAWTYDVLRWLYAAASAAGAPGDALAAIAADASSGSVSRRTTQTAVWLAGHACGVSARTGNDVCSGSPDEIELPDATLLPTLGAPIGPPPASPRLPSCAAAPAIPPPTGVLAYPTPGASVSPWIVLAVITAAVVGATILTREVPTSSSERRARKSRKP